MVEVKYKINEKCPICEKVTFSSDVCLTNDWLYSHLFQFHLGEETKQELQLCCCLSEMHWLKINKHMQYFLNVLFDLLNYTLRSSCAL